MDIKLEQSENNVSQAQLDFFIKGNVSLEKSARACPASWIPSQVRQILAYKVIDRVEINIFIFIYVGSHFAWFNEYRYP